LQVQLADPFGILAGAFKKRLCECIACSLRMDCSSGKSMGRDHGAGRIAVRHVRFREIEH